MFVNNIAIFKILSINEWKWVGDKEYTINLVDDSYIWKTQNYAYEVQCTSVPLSSTDQVAVLGRQAYHRCPMVFTTELQSEERQYTLHTFSSDCQKHTDLYSSNKAWLYGKFLT